MVAQVAIVRTAWAGTTGGPGLTQHAIEDATGAELTVAQCQTAVNAVRAFWDTIKAYIPNEVTLTVLPTVDIYGYITATLVGSHTVGVAPATVQGTDAGSYAMASGLKVNLQTEVIAFGRRIRGATYIVPGGSSTFNTSGQAATAAKTAIDAAGATLLTALATGGINLKVWSRPRTLPTERDGFVSNVSSIKTNDQTAVLRGRRD
jgi:hypothetical protein